MHLNHGSDDRAFPERVIALESTTLHFVQCSVDLTLCILLPVGFEGGRVNVNDP